MRIWRKSLSLHSTDLGALQSGIRAMVLRYPAGPVCLQDTLANGRCLQSVQNYFTKPILKRSQQDSCLFLTSILFLSCLYVFSLLSYLSSESQHLRGLDDLLPFILIGSIFGRISTNSHRHQRGRTSCQWCREDHQREQELLVSGVENNNMAQEDSIVCLALLSP